jgi:hypothetical protein
MSKINTTGCVITNSDRSAFVRFDRFQMNESPSDKYDAEHQKYVVAPTKLEEPFKKTMTKRKEAFAQIKEMFGISKRKIMPCCIKKGI